MIGYVTVGTNDLARAARFYDAIAAEMGTGRMMEFDSFIAWGTPGALPGLRQRNRSTAIPPQSATA